MSRLAITREVLISLFARSGNVCAFPGCTQELVTARNLFVGQICHIEGANLGGQRYNFNSTDEERRSVKNLILLCYPHHRETDDVTAFDTAALRAMKHQHESKHGQKLFKINEAFLHRFEDDMQKYWSDVAYSNEHRHVIPELTKKIHVGITAIEQFSEVEKSINCLAEVLATFADADAALNEDIKTHLLSLGYDLTPYDKLPYFKNPFVNRNWELHALLVNNTLTDLQISIKQAKVRFLEEYIKTHPNELEVHAQLATEKKNLLKIAVSIGYAD